jgi:phytol kinase
MSNLYGIIVSILYIGVILAASNLFSKVSKEASRKFIHIMLSNWWIIAMIFFTNMWCAAILPAIFVVVNYLSYKFNIIKSMERNEEEKDGLGTVYYALSLLILSLITFGPLKNPIIGLVGVAVMAGSAAMFVIALIIVSGALVYLNIGYWFVKALVISIISTAIEAVSIKGTDNITVPIITSLMIFLVL